MLLLHVLLELNKPFGILRFDDGWNAAQRKAVDAVIREKNLQVFSYPALSHLLVGNDAEMSLASLYAVDFEGNGTLMIRDMVHDPTRCAFDLMLERPTQTSAPIEWNTHIWGTRAEDRHWILGEDPVMPSEEWFVGEKRFVMPLAEWSREDVTEALKSYGIKELDANTGDIYCCHNCLKATGKVFCPKKSEDIDALNWDKQGNLALIQSMLRKSDVK